MAVSLKASVQTFDVNTVTIPASTVAGDLIVISTDNGNLNIPTLPTGFTLIGSPTNSNLDTLTAYKVATSADAGATVTVTAIVTAGDICVSVFTGASSWTFQQSNVPAVQSNSASTLNTETDSAPFLAVVTWTGLNTGVPAWSGQLLANAYRPMAGRYVGGGGADMSWGLYAAGATTESGIARNNTYEQTLMGFRYTLSTTGRRGFGQQIKGFRGRGAFTSFYQRTSGLFAPPKRKLVVA